MRKNKKCHLTNSKMGARMIEVNPMIYRVYSRFQAFSLGGPSGPSFLYYNLIFNYEFIVKNNEN